MSNNKFVNTLVSVGALTAGAVCAQPNSAELVDALNGVFGKHPQTRASHAKGVCVRGYFSPSASAQQVTHGPLWSASRTPVLGRFSVGGGNPKASDKGTTVRGLALNIGDQWHMVGISAPVFMVATPEEFVEFMAARRPDPQTGKPDVERVKAFNAKTPSTKAQIEYLQKSAVPASYAQANYWGVNAFVFSDAKGVKRHGRWRLVPKAGAQGLTAEQLAQLSDDFLPDELAKRLSTSPVGFDVVLQLATPADNVKDPSTAWPGSNPEVKLGEVMITSMGGDCNGTMFNPAQLPAVGMGLSDDPTLLVRAGSYAVSLGRRAASN